MGEYIHQNRVTLQVQKYETMSTTTCCSVMFPLVWWLNVAHIISDFLSGLLVHKQTQGHKIYHQTI